MSGIATNEKEKVYAGSAETQVILYASNAVKIR